MNNNQDNAGNIGTITPDTTLLPLRCRMKVFSVQTNSIPASVTWTPQYDNTIPETQRFAQGIPNGTLTMPVGDTRMVAALKVGQEFYLDLTPVTS